jgi:hypothetical protein
MHALRSIRSSGRSASAAVIVLVTCAALSAPQRAAGDVIEQWTHTYNGPGDLTDEARHVRVGPSGNVYITGWSWDGSTFYDYATQKLDPHGTLLWTRRLDRGHWDLAKCLAIGEDGSVYVTGFSSSDYVTVKYDGSGYEEWVRVFPASAGQSFSKDMDIALDQSGDIYVCGTQGGSDSDLLLLKYNADGDLLWSRAYDRPDSPCGTGRRLALWDGYVYAVGHTGIPDDLNILTVKFTGEGGFVWARTFDGPEAFSNDRGFAVAVDDSGCVVVAGQAARPGHTIDAVVVKYSADGDERWAAWHDGPGNNYDSVDSIGLDDSGNSYVAGRTSNTSWPTVDFDYLIMKHDPAGTLLWTRTHDGPGVGSNDYARDLAVDAAGNVFVTGDEFEGPVGVNEDRNIVTIAYDTYGSELWRTIYDGRGSSADYGFCLTLGPSGGVYVCGQCDLDSTSEGIAYDYLAVKYAQASGIEEGDPISSAVLLALSTPNPFRSRTTLSWVTPERLAGDPLRVAIYDVSGRLVRTLIDGTATPGADTATWDGTDRSGTRVSSGVYLCRLSLGMEAAVTPIVFLR